MPRWVHRHAVQAVPIAPVAAQVAGVAVPAAPVPAVGAGVEAQVAVVAPAALGREFFFRDNYVVLSFKTITD